MERHALRTPATSPKTFLIGCLVHQSIQLATNVAASIKAGLSRDAFNRRVLCRLSVMSDRELSDIGLTRYDVQDAALLQAGDPTHLLIARRDDRRHARYRRYPF